LFTSAAVIFTVDSIFFKFKKSRLIGFLEEIN